IVVFTGTDGVRVAYSTDGGETFQSHDDGRPVVVPEGTSRDAKVFWYEPDERVARVVHGVRTAAAAGARTVLLTNAAGGLRDGFTVGQPVLIADHLNMTATSPITGATFVDLVDLYSHRLRDEARQIDASLADGVYAGLPGPHFETPAEIRMLRTLGADLVGMSTVLEAIAARAAGMEVFGLSLVTNLAAGITGEPLNHEEVIEAGRAAAERMGGLLRELVRRA
ncbi:purine-nucleoside phosphorylase, partial [Saccharomonospora saliphila]|uniref:purine-nucleoside phosphorylase n=1 Tax=Saccharomonospora saliphila TaxID=369829 RepID=UPI00037A2D4D